jgi:hypothetical protein
LSHYANIPVKGDKKKITGIPMQSKTGGGVKSYGSDAALTEIKDAAPWECIPRHALSLS